MNTFKIKLIFIDESTQEKTLNVGCSSEELREILMDTTPNLKEIEIADHDRWRSVRVSKIEAMIDELQDAVTICYDVDNSSEDHERSYPYAAGYSRSAMQSAIRTLTDLL